jgi:hypothetical protein
VAAQGAGPRWWRRGRDTALAQARARAAAAATSFVALDDLQRRTALQVQAFAALDRGRSGEQLSRSWASLYQEADAAAVKYLQVPERYDVEADLKPADARQAENAFAQAEDAVQRVLQRVQVFAAQSAAQFATVEQTLGRLAGAAREADAAITLAREAIARDERAGTPAHEAVEALRRAEQARAVLTEGPAVHGLAAAVSAADAVLAEAARARELAESLPEQRAEVRRQLTSARTRQDAVANRRARLADTLSTLRRTFVAGSYADVEAKPTTADLELAVARDRLASAERHAADRDLPRARAAIAAARQALDTAAAAVDAVTHRLADLQALKADPQVPAQRTRFVIREAQRLFVFLGERADPRYATQLDSLLRRVAIADAGLAEPHPDYWRLDQDLARIRAETAEVVNRLRGS